MKKETSEQKENKFILNDANVELHAHPFLEKNKITDLLCAIDTNGLDVIALEGLDKSIYKNISGEVKRYFPDALMDNAGIRYDDKFILNAREYTTKEGFHLLTIGHSIEASPKSEIRNLINEGLKNNALVVIAHPFVDNEKTKTAGHISEEKEKELEKLCKEYSGEIALEWNGYCRPDLRWGLKQVLNLFGNKIKYHDVNEKVYEFVYSSPKLSSHRIPIVTGTDLHAVNRSYLFAIGTSRMWMNLEGETASEIVSSMKDNIFFRTLGKTGGYNYGENYVSMAHVIGAFGIPVIKEIIKR